LDPIDVRTFFKQPISDQRVSPIDEFIGRTDKLNKLYVPYTTNAAGWMPELGSLILLGYMSAIESYVRAVVTGLVNIDTLSRRQAGSKPITFAVATNHPNPRLLPEALMENMTFSSDGNIEKALKDILGLHTISADLKSTIREFEKLCQVRHCCVHRFGKLGSQNAWALGFENHREMIEHPFAPTPADVDRIADALQITVKTLNNFIFREVLDRTAQFEFEPTAPWQWHWHYGRDRKQFHSYYDLFALTAVEPRSPAARVVYDSFRDEHILKIKARRRDRRR
jgi:hypothetical protein